MARSDLSHEEDELDVSRFLVPSRSKWPHQIVALTMLTFVWIGFDLWAQAHLPPLRRLIGNINYVGVYLGWGLAFLLYRLRLSRGMDEATAWYHYMVHIIWVCSILAFVGWCVQAPYSDPERRVVSHMVSAALIAAGSIITVRPPSEGRMGWSGAVVPIALPASLIGYFIFHPNEKAIPMAPLFAIFTGLMLALRGTIQTMANESYSRVIRAEAAQRDAQMARERFLVAASHDLSQPLQAARLSIDQALRATGEAARKRAADRVEWALDSMESMVGQIMEHLRLGSGVAAARIGPVALQEVLDRLAGIYSSVARKKGIVLACCSTRLVVLGDASLIERIVGNLMTNAIRHARAGRILIAVRRKDERVRIWVIDNGEGILLKDEAGLFEDYVQGDHRGEIRGGYGLGLPSARRMAKLMNGDVGHDRRWYKGSAFYLDLPVA